MFVVWLNKPGVIKSLEFSNPADALIRAQTEALYGDWYLVEVCHEHDCMFTIRAKELRDASEREREARCLQRCEGVLPGV